MIKKILIYNSGGGLGDSIQLFDLILSLKNKFKNADFFYLGAHTNHFNKSLLDYNIPIKTLDLNLKYFGFRWWHLFVVKKKIKTLSFKKFDLIIDLQSKLRNTIILKMIPADHFYSSTLNFIFSSKKVNFSKVKYSINVTIQNISKLISDDINYQSYNIDLINKKFHDEACKILPDKNYVGFSLTQGNLYRKKSWSLDKFIEVAKEVVKRNDIPVFFIQKEHVEIIKLIKNQVKESIFPEEVSSLSGPALVTALSTRLKQAITIDNGIMHMISLSKIPLIVLFGPTKSSKFAPKIKDIKILDSKKIYNSSDINKISAQEVIEFLK